jgi:hypothetical protein
MGTFALPTPRHFDRNSLFAKQSTAGRHVKPRPPGNEGKEGPGPREAPVKEFYAANQRRAAAPVVWGRKASH